jgi:DMSO/TMAO reductase YedYZ molybdopterin-dependent catalytic subunit
VIAYRWILKRPRSRDRRAFLSASIVGAAGVALWALSRRAKNLLSLPGAGRRFTGSFERASFSPSFPVVSWINDSPEPVVLEDWRLTVEGSVIQPLSLDYIQLMHLASKSRQAILDCTGGWFTEQQWYGVPLTAVLALAQPELGCQSITIESITGYARRFDIERSGNMLLATQVAGDILSHGHGFPVRLVIPGERGYQWVKWLKRIQLNTTSHLLQSPLPLQ